MQATIQFDENQDPGAGKGICITYVGNDRSFAQAYFNPNAFPQAVLRHVEAAASRFAMFHYQTKLLRKLLDESTVRFIAHIEEPKMQLAEVLSRKSRDRYVAKFDGIEMLTVLHGLFYVLKSFLDVYAQLLCSLASPAQTMTFKRRRVGQRELSGGAYIRWLRDSCPQAFINRFQLATFIEEQSETWITEAVRHRDVLGHYSDIEDVHALQVSLRKIKATGDVMYDREGLQLPKMPNGELVESYVQDIGARLRCFVASTLRMFPNLKHELLRFPEFDISEPLWSD